MTEVRILKHSTPLLRLQFLLVVCCSTAACSSRAVVNDDMMRVDGSLPADFSGYWERNYGRGNDIDGALYEAYRELSRTLPDQRYAARPGVTAPPPSRDLDALVALARLAELITRPTVLTISQTEHEISIARKDDYSMLCVFHDGVAKGTDTDYGTEICGWDGNNLVSNLVLPGGLQVTHRFTVSDDREEMRVITTVSSSSSRVPVTLNRFYTRFERLPPDYNCIETLSMKRVCSTAPIVP